MEFCIFQTPGTVFDCVTWDVRYTYDPEKVKKDYKLFPEILDGAEGDAQRQVRIKCTHYVT